MENPHKGHRKRLKKRFLTESLDAFEDHNVLELLLFYAIPVKDTNEQAHKLMERFGSLSNVFDASVNDLCKVCGIKEHTAVLIKLIPALARKYMQDKNRLIGEAPSLEELEKYIAAKYIGVKEERIYIFLLDREKRLIHECEVMRGTASAVFIPISVILKTALDYSAASVIISHNHPLGAALPSSNDKVETVNLEHALHTVGIDLYDHIIIGRRGSAVHLYQDGFI